MRHAKAEAYASDDHGRALTERGRRDAEASGRWARDLGVHLDVALVSSALRARQTWEHVAAGLGCELEPTVEDALYPAGPESAMGFLRALPEEARTAMFVGHNPTAGYLVQLLNDGDGDPDAVRAVGEGYPTSAITVLAVPGAWADLEMGSCRILHSHVGRG